MPKRAIPLITNSILTLSWPLPTKALMSLNSFLNFAEKNFIKATKKLTVKLKKFYFAIFLKSKTNKFKNLKNNLKIMFQNSFNTSTEASFLSNKSTTIDRDILEKLMLYIENTLDSKLNSIEKLIDKNKSNLSKAKKKFLLAERKLMNYKRESSGSSLISDDIKFFFNLVKSKPKDKVIKGVFVKDGRPSPRFGGYSRPPVAGKSRSRSIRGISQPKRRRKDKAHLRDNDSSSLETRVIFEKSSSKVKPGKSQRNVKRRWKKDNVRKQAKKKISSVSRAKSRPKSPMKRWEQLYNMANEKSKQRVNENEDVENNRKLANTPIRLSDRVFGNGENKAFESTQKKERKYPAILDNQQSPSKKLKNQRNLLRSRRLLDSEEMERKKQRDNMCLQNISKIEKEYQSNIGYCESSDSSFEENPKTKKLTPLINPMSRRSSEFLLDSKQANNYNLKMPSTDSDQQQTMDYLELMKSRKSKKKPFEPFYPHNGTNESTSDISNLENYLTDRPNHKSPIRQKRDEHPLVALGEVEKANESDDEGEQGRTNTERLMHQSIRNLDEESFSRDQTGKRLIDGMLDMDCDNSQILNACASEGNNTWKEIEEERMQVVQMLEGMMRSGTEDVDYSSTENIFKQYETFRSNKNNQVSKFCISVF